MDAETDKRLVFLTNHFALPAPTIAQIDRQRWQALRFGHYFTKSSASALE